MANPAPYCGTRAVQLKNLSTVDFGNVTKLEIYWDFANAPTVKEVIDVPVSGKIYPHSYPDPPVRNNIRSGWWRIQVVLPVLIFHQRQLRFTRFQKLRLMYRPQLCFGDVVIFTDKSNGISSAATTWQWDLGKGISSNIQNPVHQYNDSGFIDVSLYFTNADGCVSDTAVKTLTIYPNPKLTLKHNELVLSGGTLPLSRNMYMATNCNIYGRRLRILAVIHRWRQNVYLMMISHIN
jgi:hypothetical protein